MACTNCGGDARTIITDGDGVTFTGVGTAVDPYVPHLSDLSSQIAFEVRDSQSINFTLFGSGLPSDPYVLTGDTSSASRLANLADVSSSVAPTQGQVPMWIGSSAAGQFQFRLPGTRYTTHATRGNGTFQGEQIKETDTGSRFEWDGSQWVSLDSTSVPPSALDPSVVQSKGTIGSTTDWNTLTNSAIYRVNGAVTSSNNSPVGAYAYGTLVVANSGLSTTQTYWTHITNKVWYRTKYNAADWQAWASVATNGDVSAEITARQNADATLQSNVDAEVSARTYAISKLSSTVSARYAQRISITSGGGSRNSTNITFPAGRFSSIPNGVSVTPSTTTPDNCHVGYMNLTATGMTVWLSRDDSASGGGGILTELSVIVELIP
jgi:hypothetical protein